MAPRLALSGGTVYTGPGGEPVRDGVVIVDPPNITAVGRRGAVRVPAEIRTIDCTGMTVVAGLWNSHVHFFERQWAGAASIPPHELSRQLRDLTRYGFTNVFDLSSPWQNTRSLRDRIESGEIPGPRIRSTGEGLAPPGALPADAVLGLMGMTKTPLPEVVDAADAAKAATALLDDGVDGIKVFASTQSGTVLSAASIAAAVDAAHRRGVCIFAHPNSAADVRTALQAGVDVIAHTTPHFKWDEALLGDVQKRRAALTPTLTLWSFFMRHDRASIREQIADAAAAQLRAWIDAGGTLLFGTDAGAVATDPTQEYVLMAGAGMTFRQILAALTTTPGNVRPTGTSRQNCGRVSSRLGGVGGRPGR